MNHLEWEELAAPPMTPLKSRSVQEADIEPQIYCVISDQKAIKKL
jgi:hypothetical protein